MRFAVDGKVEVYVPKLGRKFVFGCVVVFSAFLNIFFSVFHAKSRVLKKTCLKFSYNFQLVNL